MRSFPHNYRDSNHHFETCFGIWAYLHPLAKRETDLTLLLAQNGEAWKKYGQFYEGWTLDEVAELLEAVRAAS